VVKAGSRGLLKGSGPALPIETTAPGLISVELAMSGASASAKRKKLVVARGGSRVRAPGAYSVRLRATRGGRKRLRSLHRTKARLRIEFRKKGGRAHSKTVSLTLNGSQASRSRGTTPG
jgi:hypothetical protein